MAIFEDLYFGSLGSRHESQCILVVDSLVSCSFEYCETWKEMLKLTIGARRQRNTYIFGVWFSNFPSLATDSFLNR